MTSHFEKFIYYYLVLAMAIWGISWPTSKILTYYTDTYTLVFLKFIISAITMIPVILSFKQKNKFSKKLLFLLFAGVLAIGIYNALFFVAIKIGLAGFGGVLVTTTNPLITFATISIIEKINLEKNKKFALILGLIGGLIMLKIWDFDFLSLISSGNFLFLLASFFWTIVTLLSAKAKELMGSLLFTFYLYFFSSLLSLFFVDFNNLIDIFNYELYFWINLIFSTAISTGFATAIYFKAATIIGPSNTSSFIFFVPFIALVSSSIILKEIPDITTIIGGILTIIAIYLLNKK